MPEATDGHITLRVPVEANQRLRVAETYVAPYIEVAAFLTEMSDERADRCEAFSMGTTVEGRDVVGLKAGTPGKPKVMCVAGQHPHEHGGVWAAAGIADFVSSRLATAERLREQVEVYVIEEPDPADGNIAVSAAASLTITYPDGPHDAEGIAVTPAGDLVIVTKEQVRSTLVFTLPADQVRVALESGAPLTPAAGQLKASSGATRLGHFLAGGWCPFRLVSPPAVA